MDGVAFCLEANSFNIITVVVERPFRPFSGRDFVSYFETYLKEGSKTICEKQAKKAEKKAEKVLNFKSKATIYDLWF